MYFLEHPEEITENGYNVFGTAIWYYMTPNEIEHIPSMHDVMTSLFKPNEEDKKARILANFGTTVNILTGGSITSDGSECGRRGSQCHLFDAC